MGNYKRVVSTLNRAVCRVAILIALLTTMNLQVTPYTSVTVYALYDLIHPAVVPFLVWGFGFGFVVCCVQPSLSVCALRAEGVNPTSALQKGFRIQGLRGT